MMVRDFSDAAQQFRDFIDPTVSYIDHKADFERLEGHNVLLRLSMAKEKEETASP